VVEKTQSPADLKTVRWIDLNDPSGAKLKLANINIDGEEVRHLFIVNLSWRNESWEKAQRVLGFRSPQNRKYLVRRVLPKEKIALSDFRKVFPDARMVDVEAKSYVLGAAQEDARRQVDVDLRGCTRLGRNPDGFEVYEGVSGRFYIDAKGRRVLEPEAQDGRLNGAAGVEFCALIPSGFSRLEDFSPKRCVPGYACWRRASFNRCAVASLCMSRRWRPLHVPCLAWSVHPMSKWMR